MASPIPRIHCCIHNNFKNAKRRRHKLLIGIAAA
jgi:hypothetical protein